MKYSQSNLPTPQLGIPTHEIGHTIGFWHEQARPDRGSYVNIVKNNIASKYLSQFSKQSTRTSEERDVSYDYGSIMHYASKVGSTMARLSPWICT